MAHSKRSLSNKYLMIHVIVTNSMHCVRLSRERSISSASESQRHPPRGGPRRVWKEFIRMIKDEEVYFRCVPKKKGLKQYEYLKNLQKASVINAGQGL